MCDWHFWFSLQCESHRPMISHHPVRGKKTFRQRNLIFHPNIIEWMHNSLIVFNNYRQLCFSGNTVTSVGITVGLLLAWACSWTVSQSNKWIYIRLENPYKSNTNSLLISDNLSHGSNVNKARDFFFLSTISVIISPHIIFHICTMPITMKLFTW